MAIIDLIYASWYYYELPPKYQIDLNARAQESKLVVTIFKCEDYCP